MPDLKSVDAAANVTADAYESGQYEMVPHIAPKPEPEPAPEAEPAPAPADLSAFLIRMVHPEGGVADGYETDGDGAILVPHPEVEALKSHGFVVEHKPHGGE